MTSANVDWMALVINWGPMVLIFGVWLYFLRQMQNRGGYYGNQKRVADALERIAAALEKRH